MSSNKSDISPRETIAKARLLWMSATDEADLKQVECLYRQALRINTAAKKKRKSSEGGCNKNQEENDDDDNRSSVVDRDDDVDDLERVQGKKEKRSKRKSDKISKKDNSSCLKRSECKKAFERLALLLCQSGRSKKAKVILARLGYQCRLSTVVLDYPLPSLSDIGNDTTMKDKASEIPCCILDGFMQRSEIQQLRKVFESPLASYWINHDYAIEPPSPYFSYILPLQEASNLGFIGGLIRKIFHCKILRKKFPKLKNATKVEMWAHNRPHPSGHQMHFDSDDEGRDGIRNPIISTILYVTAGCGGPSLVTNQKLIDNHLATKGWMCHPQNERLVAFDGRYLHGVIPGKAVQPGRRVTLMFAFWADIRTRKDNGPGSARLFPYNDDSCEWAKFLTDQVSCQNKANEYIEVDPLPIDRIYETLDGKRWSKSMGMPEYDVVFQGF